MEKKWDFQGIKRTVDMLPPNHPGRTSVMRWKETKKCCCSVSRKNNSQVWIESGRSDSEFEYWSSHLESETKFEKKMNELKFSSLNLWLLGGMLNKAWFYMCLSWHWSNHLWSVKFNKRLKTLEVLEVMINMWESLHCMFIDGVLLFDDLKNTGNRRRKLLHCESRAC